MKKMIYNKLHQSNDNFESKTEDIESNLKDDKNDVLTNDDIFTKIKKNKIFNLLKLAFYIIYIINTILNIYIGGLNNKCVNVLITKVINYHVI